MKPSFVRVEDKNKRAELCSWLKEQGYSVCCCTLFDGWNTIYCNNIVLENSPYKDIHGIPDYDDELLFPTLEAFKKENVKKRHPLIDCGEDVEMFKELVKLK